MTRELPADALPVRTSTLHKLIAAMRVAEKVADGEAVDAYIDLHGAVVEFVEANGWELMASALVTDAQAAMAAEMQGTDGVARDEPVRIDDDGNVVVPREFVADIVIDREGVPRT